MAGKPLDPQQIETIARISVLEFLVANLFNQHYMRIEATMEQIKEDHRKVSNLLKRNTNPGFDAAQSDLITGEM